MFIIAVVTLGAIAVGKQWPEVQDSIGRLSPVSLVLSLCAVFAALVTSVLIWRAVLSDLGSPLTFGTAARIFFVAQLGKYIPGSVWPMLAQMEMARDRGVPRRRSGAAYVITVLIVFVAGLAAAAATLPLAASDTAAHYRWLFLLAPVIVVALHPRLLNPALALIFRVTRREPPERPLTWRGLGAAFGYALVAWTFFGLHLAALVTDLGVGIGRAILLSIGCFALAWIGGLLVVVAPAGAGAREVALVALLAPVLDRGEAIVAALVSRLLMTIGDLLAAAAAAIAYARRRQPD
jgi:uncharacterized membrane protein YbhN (UPF0104 family)